MASGDVMRNSLLLVIDALRFDALQDESARRALFPTLSRLVEEGVLAKLTTNAQSTQFVMPALFCQSYPLDYGGYNRGILDRPETYAETIRNAGYRTGLYSACNQLSVGMGYERGFDTRCAAVDYRLLIEHRITRFLNYYIDEMRRGERTRDEVLELIRDDFRALLVQIGENFENDDKAAWSRALWRINSRIVRCVAGEIELIDTDANAVLEKMMRLPAGIYWHFLGLKEINPARLFLTRAVESLQWRSRRWLSKRRFPPFLLVSYIEAVAPEILKPAIDAIEKQDKTGPWHMHVHLMDVHDARAINRMGNFLIRTRYFPRWLKGYISGHTRRHWVYDTALMYVDAKLRPLVEALENTGQLENTCVVVTGDHGNSFARSPRKKPGIEMRTYREDLEVPLAIRAPWKREPVRDGLYDSMTVTASLLDCLGIAPPASFLGRSIFEGGKNVVVSESCGSGNADVAVRDLHFTVTGRRHKMMARLCDTQLRVIQVYDLESDPLEQRDLAGEPDSKSIVNGLVDSLVQERTDLFKFRAVDASSLRWELAS